MPTIVDEYISEENQGGGGGGPGGDKLTILQTKKNLSQNYSIDPAYNAASVGPVTTDLGVVVTVPLGSTYVTLPGTGGGSGGSFPAVENFVIVSDVATEETGKIYNTIAGAIAYINTLSLSITNKAVIHVYSKIDSSNFVVPLYCTVQALREGAALTGTISSTGVIAVDANLLNFFRLPTLKGFYITGTVDFSALTTLFDGNMLMINCNIRPDGGGIVTGPNYKGVFRALDSFIYKVNFQSATIFNMVRSIIGGTHVYNNTTASTKSVQFENCVIDQSGQYPSTNAQFTVDGTTSTMSLTFFGCQHKFRINLISSGTNGNVGLFYAQGQTGSPSFFNVTGYTGTLSITSNAYVKNVSNNEATENTVDRALDELYDIKERRAVGFNPSKVYRVNDQMADGSQTGYPTAIVRAKNFVPGNGDPFDKTDWIQYPLSYVTVSSPTYTIGQNESVIYVDASANNVILTLPSEDFVTKEYVIKRIDSNTANYVRINNFYNSSQALYLHFPGEFVKLFVSSIGGTAHTNHIISKSSYFDTISTVSSPLALTFGSAVNCSLDDLLTRLNLVSPQRNSPVNFIELRGQIRVNITAAAVNTEFVIALPTSGAVSYAGGSLNDTFLASAYDITDNFNAIPVALVGVGSDLVFKFKPTTTNIHLINFTAQVSYQ